MTLTQGWLAGVFALNVVLGALLVLIVFTVMERRFGVGAVSGIVVGGTVIYVEATLGERLLTLSVSEMKVLVLLAALGAVIGVVGTVFTVEPELETN